MKMKFILPLVMLLMYNNGFSQVTLKAQKTIGGNMEDILNAFALTKDGGMILAGSSASGISGDKTTPLGFAGDHDFWFVKLNAKGNIEWDVDLDDWDKDHISAIEQTTDGGYIAVGGTAGWYQSDESTRAKIFKLDSHGNEEWRGGDYDNLYCVKQTTDGGYIFGGSHKIWINEENYNTDLLLVKYDVHGARQWSKIFGNELYERIVSIALTEDNGFLLGASVDADNSETDTTKRARQDYRIIKTDGEGNIQWSKYIGAYRSDYLTTIVYSKDGGCLLAGSSNSDKSGDKTENNRGGGNRTNDYWVVKLNSKGVVVWDKTIGGSDADNLSSAMQTKDGGYILGGYSYSGASGDKTNPSKGGLDYWIVKLSRHGDIEWDKTIGTAEDDKLGAVLERDKNTYIAGGYTMAGISGDKTDTSRGGLADFWLVSFISKHEAALLAQTTESNLNTSPLQQTLSWMVYPNPAKDKVYIQVKGKATITITDQSGKIVLVKTVDTRSEINVAGLAAGIYYVRTSQTKQVQKLQIVR